MATSAPPPPRRATISDVARAAGVSISTASVVFSGKANVSEATRERVLAAASALGYTGPDPRAASLRTGRSGIVAVVLQGALRHTFLDPVTIATMDGLTDGLTAVGADVLLLRDESDRPGGAALTNAPVDAAVLLGCSSRTRESLDTARARQLPLVVIEGDAGEGVPRITLDNAEASADIARHVRQQGHRDAAVITLPLAADRERGAVSDERLARATVQPAIERLAGIRSVFPDARAVSTAASSIDEGVRAAAELLDGPSPPTVILAQSDMLAAGAIRAAQERGLRVPEDISITGFDGVRVDGLSDHILTTSVQPATEKGRAAGAQIAAMLEGGEGRCVHLICRFRPGTTTAPPRSEATL